MFGYQGGGEGGEGEGEGEGGDCYSDYFDGTLSCVAADADDDASCCHC